MICMANVIMRCPKNHHSLANHALGTMFNHFFKRNKCIIPTWLVYSHHHGTSKKPLEKASQRSHDEASGESLLMKLLEKTTWSCLGKNAAQPSLTIGSSRNVVCNFTRHLSMIWPLGSLRRCLESARNFRSREHLLFKHFNLCFRVA